MLGVVYVRSRIPAHTTRMCANAHGVRACEVRVCGCAVGRAGACAHVHACAHARACPCVCAHVCPCLFLFGQPLVNLLFIRVEPSYDKGTH